MRTRLVGSSVTALTVIVASCTLPEAGKSSCEDDAELCPPSLPTATSVTCDCRCTLGMSESEGENFDGRVDVCLPAELNSAMAAGEQLTTLQALKSRDLNQRVFQYCSQDVARFLRTAVKSRARGLAGCAVPVRCECTTRGAKRDSGACHAGCPDVACDAENCPAVLWRGAKLDATACRCSRAAACGTLAPAEEAASLCRDWATTPPIITLTP